MPPEFILDPATLDLTRVVADIDAIRAFNPQRHEFEMLTAVVLVDPARHVCAAYKDLTHDEFWVRGHFPGAPLLPGVLMCEAAAQLCSYYMLAEKLTAPGTVVGLGGLENARFRAPVRPGDRLVLVSQGTRVHRRQSVFTVQGFVGSQMAFHADVIGIPLPSSGAADRA